MKGHGEKIVNEDGLLVMQGFKGGTWGHRRHNEEVMIRREGARREMQRGGIVQEEGR